MGLYLTDQITVLKGIGDKMAALFRRMGVQTVEELVRLYPRDYDRIEEVCRIVELKDNCRAVVRGTVCSGVSEKKTGRPQQAPDIRAAVQKAPERQRAQFPAFP